MVITNGKTPESDAIMRENDVILVDNAITLKTMLYAFFLLVLLHMFSVVFSFHFLSRQKKTFWKILNSRYVCFFIKKGNPVEIT